MQRPWWKRPGCKDLLTMEAEPEDPYDLKPWAHCRKAPTSETSTPERSSPQLYEVELTASEEDDDTSALELVIPIRSSSYQRVPTTSPEKTTRKAPRLFCTLFCCVRK